MFGELFSAGLGFLGNWLGKESAEDEADAARSFQAQQAANNEALQREFWDKNAALQREFAQSGIRWRVADAKAAGLHPLFALSGGGASYTPTAVVGSEQAYPRSNSGEYLSRMGQDIGRAVRATQTRDERNGDMMDALSLERAQLENDLLKAQIAKTTGQLGPAMPSVRSSNAMGDKAYGSWSIEPNEVIAAQPGYPSQAAGLPAPSVQWTAVAGGLRASPTKPTGVEDEFGAPLMGEWLVDNRLGPFFDPKAYAPPMSVVRQHWPNALGVRWDGWSLKWKPVFAPSEWRGKLPPYEGGYPSRRMSPGRGPSERRDYGSTFLGAP